MSLPKSLHFSPKAKNLRIMKNAAKLYPILFLILGIFASGCDYFSQGNVDLDNAGEETLIVTINELSYKMNPGGYILIDLNPGYHTLVVKDENGKELEQETFEVVNGGLINLAKEEYYIWSDLYGDQSLKEAKLKQEWVEIEEQTFYGEITKLEGEGIYQEGEWDYGLSEDFPARLWGWVITDEKYEIKKKLFRKQGLIDAYLARVNTPEAEENQ